jgi:hypothetical protein
MFVQAGSCWPTPGAVGDAMMGGFYCAANLGQLWSGA